MHSCSFRQLWPPDSCNQQCRYALTSVTPLNFLMQAGLALESLSGWICSTSSRVLGPRTPQSPQAPPRTPKQPLKEVPQAGQQLHAFMSSPYAALLQANSPGKLGSDPAAAPSHWEPAALCRVLEVGLRT